MTTHDDHAQRRVEAGRIAGNTNLFDIRLTQSSGQLHSVPSTDAQLDVDVKISPSAQCLPAEGDSGLLLVNAAFEVLIRDVNVESEEPVAEIMVTFTAAFQHSLSNEPTQAELDSFADTTGIFAIYPYAREYVSDTTRRMGLPTLVLDLLKR